MQRGAAQSHRTQTHPWESTSCAIYLNSVILETCSRPTSLPKAKSWFGDSVQRVASASTKTWARGRNSSRGSESGLSPLPAPPPLGQ